MDNPLGVLAEFAPNEAFLAYAGSAALASTRRFRDHIVYRERSRYRELPGFGRTSLSPQSNFSISFPPRDNPDQNMPTLDDCRREVGRGLEEALWAHTKRWLTTIDVWITPLPGAQVKVTTRHLIGGSRNDFPEGLAIRDRSCTDVTRGVDEHQRHLDLALIAERELPA